MRGCVPVGEMLGVLGTEGPAMPELDIAALADRLAAHGQQDQCRDDDEAKGDEGGQGTAGHGRSRPSASATSKSMWIRTSNRRIGSRWMMNYYWSRRVFVAVAVAVVLVAVAAAAGSLPGRMAVASPWSS